MLEQNRFILAHASDFWATVYTKRRTTKYACNSNFDAAANINQTWYNNFYEQDCMVKQAFRNFVDYIAEVRLAIHNILFVEITKIFRMSAQTNTSILINCSNWHWSCIFKPKNIQLKKMPWLAPYCFWLINSNNMRV